MTHILRMTHLLVILVLLLFFLHVFLARDLGGHGHYCWGAYHVGKFNSN